MRRLWPVLLVATLALAGCSQVAAIAPVGGDRLAEVRFAGLDVLVDANIDILTAPVCTETAGTVTCDGDTVTGAAIAVISTEAAPDDLFVTVGGEPLYDGSLQDVLEKAMGGE